MTITKKDIIDIHRALVALSNAQTTAWYAVSKNILRTKKHFEECQEMLKSIQENLSEKDKDGKPKTDPQGNVIFGDRAAEADSLFEDFLSETVEVDFHTVKWDTIKVRDKDGSMVEADLPASVMMPLINTVIVD